MQVLYTILSFILLIKLSIEGVTIFLQQKLLQPCLSTLLQKMLQQFAILGLFGSSTNDSDISNISLYHPLKSFLILFFKIFEMIQNLVYHVAGFCKTTSVFQTYAMSNLMKSFLQCTLVGPSV